VRLESVEQERGEKLSVVDEVREAIVEGAPPPVQEEPKEELPAVGEEQMLAEPLVPTPPPPVLEEAIRALGIREEVPTEVVARVLVALCRALADYNRRVEEEKRRLIEEKEAAERERNQAEEAARALNTVIDNLKRRNARLEEELRKLRAAMQGVL